jgi:arginine deiminase
MWHLPLDEQIDIPRTLIASDDPERIMKAGAGAEWHTLRDVLVHEPGIEVFFALTAPKYHLYERFFSLDAARQEHRRFCRVLHDDFGVRVHHLAAAVRDGAARNPVIRATLEEVADDEGKKMDPPAAERDVGNLLLTAVLDPVARDGRITLGKTMHNLYFMRDQQVCTACGMVMGRMATVERQREVAIAGLALAALGAEPIGAVRAGRCEGGDFIPAGEFALVGCGSRSDRRGIESLLSCDIGFDEVAVVHEPVHPLVRGRDPMVNMHLDTYCNLAGDGIAVGTPALLDRAAVEVLHREGDGFVKTGWDGSLAAYLREKEFAVVPVTTLEQLCYASNFLCMRDREGVAVDTGAIAPCVLERLQEKAAERPGKYDALLAVAREDYRRLGAGAGFFPYTKEVAAAGLEMGTVALTNATGGYGGAHCMTCTVRRR